MNRKKVLNNQILLSVVALLVIFVLSVSITFSWIEGGTTYTIETGENGSLKTESELKDVDYNGTVKLNPATSGVATLNLLDYDKTTNKHQEIYFSPVSSENGKDFYFPINMQGSTTPMYRVANTNDLGTKYINFDFDVVALKKCFLAFNDKPEITVTKSGGEVVTDTSAFRIMISDGTEAGTHIFSTGGEQTSQVVTSLSGTTPTMTSFTTESFDGYCNNTDKTGRIFSYDKNDTGNIQVAVWLDSGSDTSGLLGHNVTISMELIVVADNVKATFDAVTYDRTGAKETNGFTGGSITYGSESHMQKFEKTGTTFSATAVANNGYEFQGWFSDAACTKSVGTSALLSKSPEEDVTYYAKFQEITKTTIYVEPRSGFTTYSVYAYRKDGSTTYHYTGNGSTTTNNWPGVAAQKDNNTGYFKFEFKTTDIGNFNVIISNNGSSQYPGVNEEGLVGTLGKTYLFRADNTLVEFDPQDMITFKTQATPSSYGSAYVNGASSVKILSGDKVSLTANVVSGYRFVGWYIDSECTTAIGDNYTTATLNNVTITGAEGSTITYYAKFEKIPVLTVKTNVTPSGYGTAKVNDATSVSNIKSGTSVTLSAVANSGYEFVGWYTNSDCSTTIGANFDSASTTYEVTGTDGATVNLYAKFQLKPESVTTIYFTPRSGFTDYYAWVWNNATSTNYSGGSWPGTLATFDSATGCYKYTFKTKETGEFQVIVSNGNGTQYPSSDGLTGNIGGTYLFNGTSLSSFSPTSVVTITFNASSTTWVSEANAEIYVEDTSTNGRYMMTRTSSTSYTWTAKVPSVVTNITFDRDNPSGGTWNSWNAGSRGTKTTYKTSGDGTGSWQ